MRHLSTASFLLLLVTASASAKDISQSCPAGQRWNAKKKSCVAANGSATAKAAAPKPICETPDECIAAIQKVLQEGVGFATDTTKVDEVLFTGSSTYVVSSWVDGTPYLSLKVTNDMPWAEFQKFKPFGACEEAEPWCDFSFDFGRQVNEQSEVLRKNDVFTPKTDPGYFYVKLPRSQIPAGVDAVSAAAARLSELTKQGKFTPTTETLLPPQLKTLKAHGVRMIKTIEGKPTYEQTVKFITSHFDKDFFRDGKYFECGNAVKDTDLYREEKVAIQKVEFDGCRLETEFTETESWIGLNREDKTETRHATTNFAEVTDIGLQRRGDGIYCYGFVFRPSKSDDWVLPFARMDASDGDFDTLKEGKLYKALDHLRKLCGAPEPLEF